MVFSSNIPSSQLTDGGVMGRALATRMRGWWFKSQPGQSQEIKKKIGSRYILSLAFSLRAIPTKQ